MNNRSIYFKSAGKMAETFLKNTKGQVLQLALADGLDQTALNKILNLIDIEALPSGEVLLVAYALQKHRNLDFGPYNVPRLEGLIRYHRFSNLNQISSFSRTAGALNASGIIPLVSYDIAMKYYDPESCRIIEGTGITDGSGEQYGIEVTAFHARCRVPSAEDMVLITLHRIWNNLRYRDDFRGIAADIWNLNYMLREYGISQEILGNEFSKNDRYILQCSFAGRFVNHVVSDLIPDDMLEKTVNERIGGFMKKNARGM